MKQEKKDQGSSALAAGGRSDGPTPPSVENRYDASTRAA